MKYIYIKYPTIKSVNQNSTTSIYEKKSDADDDDDRKMGTKIKGREISIE